MKRGISLIVLVITIVVSLILLSVVVLNFSDDNIISKATEVSFKSTSKSYEDALMIYISNKKNGTCF
jgi:Tfp pilus assembly protein PilW